MAVTQSSNVSLLVDAQLMSSVDALSTVTDKLFKSYAFALGQGTGDGQANNYYHAQVTLAASATANIDLAGSVLSPVTGAALTFTKVKALLVKADPANTNNVLVSRPASNGFVMFSAAGDEVAVQPGGIFFLTAPNTGITVTAATGDLITFTNSAAGTGVSYDVIIIGLAT